VSSGGTADGNGGRNFFGKPQKEKRKRASRVLHQEKVAERFGKGLGPEEKLCKKEPNSQRKNVLRECPKKGGCILEGGSGGKWVPPVKEKRGQDRVFANPLMKKGRIVLKPLTEGKREQPLISDTTAKKKNRPEKRFCKTEEKGCCKRRESRNQGEVVGGGGWPL